MIAPDDRQPACVRVHPPSAHEGFTLTELLVVMGTLGVLVGLIAPALSFAQERARRIQCASNLRQMVHAAIMYGQEDPGGNLSNAYHDTNDVLTFLYPDYLNATRVFTCPSTDNRVREDVWIDHPITGRRELLDLTGYAGSPTNHGSSYELFGFMNHTPDTPLRTRFEVNGRSWSVRGVKKTLHSIQSHAHVSPAFGLMGTIAGPSRIWLVVDGDEPPGRQNFPDPDNNHGDAGGNAAFCDGHVEWVPTKTYLFQYEMSQDENRSSLD